MGLNYYFTLKIYFLSLKIYFHSVILYFHIEKIVLSMVKACFIFRRKKLFLLGYRIFLS